MPPWYQGIGEVLIPPSLAHRPDLRQRARAWGAVCLLVGALSAGFAGFHFQAGEWLNGIFDAAGCLVLISCAVYLQRSGKLNALVQASCATSIFLALKSILLPSESAIANLALYSMLPLLSTLAIGRQRGWLWAVITILLLPLFALHYAGTNPIYLNIPIAFVLLFTGIGGLMWNYEIAGDELRQERDDALEALGAEKQTTDDLLRERSDFVNSVSHEFRTPLNHILGATELLSQTTLDEEQADLVSITETSGNRLLKCIDDAINVQDLSQGNILLQPEWIDVHILLDRVHRHFAPLAHKKSLRFRHHIDAQIPKRLFGDPKKLEQIQHHLLDNALAFTHHGAIDLHARYLGDGRIGFSVSDSGEGIPKEKMKDIFRPFCKADNSNTRTHGGLGTGLCLSQQLIRLMGGKLSVKSIPKRGSVFSFEVVLQEDHSLQGSHDITSDDHSQSAGPSKARVILAEANRRVRKSFLGMLERMGLEAHVVANQQELVDFVDDHSVDIIFIDAELPGTSNLSKLVQVLQRKDHLQSTCFVALLRAEALEKPSGFDDHLPKPLRREQVVSIIHNWQSYSSLVR